MAIETLTGVDVAFWILAAGAVASSVVVVTNRNPVACVLFLVLSFFCLAGLFVTLHQHFLAAIQVLVYAGAIMVLFLFVVMLLNLGQPQWFDVAGPPLVAVAVALGAGFLGVLVAGGLPEYVTPGAGPASAIPAAIRGSTKGVATVLYTVYYIPFIATALLLLVAMVGAVVLVRRVR